MSNMGRPHKSLQEKMLTGARVRNDRDAEAMVANANVKLVMPPCPNWVKGEARKHWDTLGPALVEAGLLSAVDGDVFAMHCDNVARYAVVMEKLDDIENWLSKTPNGFQVQAGFVQIRNKLQEQILRTAKEFGLTPAARSGVKVEKPKQGSLFGEVAADDDPYRNFTPRS